MSDSYDPDANDVRDESSISKTTRRGVLGALGVGALTSLATGGASAQLGGGPEADEMSDHRVPYYRAPESELDTPGVVGRRVEITEGGSNWSAGDQLVDTGTSWELINAGVESLKTVDSTTERLAFEGDTSPTSPRQPEFGSYHALRPLPAIDNPIVSNAADPFYRKRNGKHVIFLEDFDQDPKSISYIESEDGYNWSSKTVAIGGVAGGLAYPIEYEVDGTIYMAPTGSTSTANDVQRIYTADSWPDSWTLAETLDGQTTFGISEVRDFTPFYYHQDDRWYALVQDAAQDNHLFYADQGRPLVGRSWTEHPESPVFTTDKMRGTPHVNRDGSVTIFGQPDVTQRVITDLSTSTFTATTLQQIIGAHSNGAWNNDTMHHCDVIPPSLSADRPVAAVDGFDSSWHIGLYTLGQSEVLAGEAFLDTNTSTSNTDTPVPLDTINHETPRINVGPSADQITVEQSGYYRLDGQVTFIAADGLPWTASASIRNKDTSTYLLSKEVQVTESTYSLSLPSKTVYLSSGDSIELRVRQDSTTDQLLNGGEQWTYLSVTKDGT